MKISERLYGALLYRVIIVLRGKIFRFPQMRRVFLLVVRDIRFPEHTRELKDGRIFSYLFRRKHRYLVLNRAVFENEHYPFALCGCVFPDVPALIFLDTVTGKNAFKQPVTYGIQRRSGAYAAALAGFCRVGKKEGVQFVFPFAAVDVHQRIGVFYHLVRPFAVVFYFPFRFREVIFPVCMISGDRFSRKGCGTGNFQKMQENRVLRIL